MKKTEVTDRLRGDGGVGGQDEIMIGTVARDAKSQTLII